MPGAIRGVGSRQSSTAGTFTVAVNPYLAYTVRVKWDGRYVAAVMASVDCRAPRTS
jgi:hypothetical protein